jgi:hypothetical protein
MNVPFFSSAPTLALDARDHGVHGLAAFTRITP